MIVNDIKLIITVFRLICEQFLSSLHPIISLKIGWPLTHFDYGLSLLIWDNLLIYVGDLIDQVAVVKNLTAFSPTFILEQLAFIMDNNFVDFEAAVELSDSYLNLNNRIEGVAVVFYPMNRPKQVSSWDEDNLLLIFDLCFPNQN